MAAVIVITVATLVLLVVAMLRSIADERTPGRSVWREFGLSMVLGILFTATWIGQLVAQYQTAVDEARAHGESLQTGDFVASFMQSTLENWQSEFLQLFSFVVLSALYIHKSSSESKDGEENIAASLRRIEEHLGTLPSTAPDAPGQEWKLPETPLEAEDRVLGRPVAAVRGR
jgi:hypothetical protein